MFVFVSSVYHSIGGVENLIINLASHLYLNYNEKVKIVGNKESYLFTRLKDESIEFIFKDYNEKKDINFTDKNDLVILFYNAYHIRNFVNPKTKIIIWNVISEPLLRWNRLNIEEKLTGKNLISKYLSKKLILSLCQKDAFFYMDFDTKEVITKFLGFEVKRPYLPVPIDCSRNFFMERSNNFFNNEKIKITYIGRGESIWKIYPVKKVVKDFIDLNIPFELHIFTNQNNLFLEILKDFDTTNIFYHFNYYGQELKEKLLTISDLHISMGTSALEGSSLGLPTILIDAGNTDFPENYKYSWIFEKKEFSLGVIIRKEQEFEGHSMAEILKNISGEQYSSLSERSFDYTLKNHSVAETVNRLKKVQSNATFKDVRKYTLNSWIISDIIFGIKNIVKKLR